MGKGVRSIVAVAVGFVLAGLVIVVLFALVSWRGALDSGPGLLVLNGVFGALAGGLGGYLAGVLAGRHALLHAGAVAALWMAVAILRALVPPGTESGAVDAASAAGVLTGALLGGLRARSVEDRLRRRRDARLARLLGRGNGGDPE